MTVQPGNGRGRRESPASQYCEGGKLPDAKPVDNRSAREKFTAFLQELRDQDLIGEKLHRFLKMSVAAFGASDWTPESFQRASNAIGLMKDHGSAAVFIQRAYTYYPQEKDDAAPIFQSIRKIPLVLEEDVVWLEAIYFIFLAARKNNKELLGTI